MDRQEYHRQYEEQARKRNLAVYFAVQRGDEPYARLSTLRAILEPVRNVRAAPAVWDEVHLKLVGLTADPKDPVAFEAVNCCIAAVIHCHRNAILIESLR